MFTAPMLNSVDVENYSWRAELFSNKNVRGVTNYVKKYLGRKYNVNPSTINITDEFVKFELLNQSSELNFMNFDRTPLHFNDNYVAPFMGSNHGTTKPIDVVRMLDLMTARSILTKFSISEGIMSNWRNYDPRGKDHRCMPYLPLDIGAKPIRNLRERDIFYEYVGPGS